MTFVGHISAGIIVGTALKLAGMPDAVVPISIIAASLPDIDGPIYFAKKRKIAIGDDFAHHEWLTHKPIFWILPGIIAMISDFIFFDFAHAWFFAAYFLSIISHFFFDSIGSTDGIQWFYPFSRKWFLFWEVRATKGEWLKKYLEHPSSNIERGLTAVAFFALGYLFFSWLILK